MDTNLRQWGDAMTTWTERTTSGSRAWRNVASSADGVNLVASVDSGYIYVSADSGATWTERTAAGSRVWMALASSSTGAKLVAGNDGGYLYTSP